MHQQNNYILTWHYIELIKISCNIMEKTHIAAIVVIVLASLYFSADWKSIQKQLKWGEDSRIYLYSNSIKGPYQFGLVCNSTIIGMNYYSAFKICNLESATYIVYNIFDVLPRHAKTINDPNVAVAKAIDGDFAYYLLVNGTKWKFTGGANATYNYGIDSSKVIYTNYTYLNTFPTTEYLH